MWLPTIKKEAINKYEWTLLPKWSVILPRRVHLNEEKRG